jgi:hypothetical protein
MLDKLYIFWGDNTNNILFVMRSLPGDSQAGNFFKVYSISPD